MTVGRAACLVGVALLVLVVNIAVSVLYMVVYGHVIDPGHEPKYYNDHVQMAAPYCSILVGILLMLLAGWWVTGWWGRTLGAKAALFVWLAYAMIDLAILLAAGVSLSAGLMVGVSLATKLAAAYCGAWLRLRRRAESSAGAR